MPRTAKTTRISATQLLTERGEILRRCYRDKEHFIIENHGLPIAVMIPFSEYPSDAELQSTKPRKPR